MAFTGRGKQMLDMWFAHEQVVELDALPQCHCGVLSSCSEASLRANILSDFVNWAQPRCPDGPTWLS